MKRTIKRCLLSLTFSIICGFICGKLVYRIYSDDSKLELKNNKIYLIQSGTYPSYEKMRASTINYDYVFYEEDGEYKSIIGITKNQNNIDKIINNYNIDVVVTEYYLNDDNINNILNKKDDELMLVSDDKKIREIISSMLNIYKKEDLKLTKVY